MELSIHTRVYWLALRPPYSTLVHLFLIAGKIYQKPCGLNKCPVINATTWYLSARSTQVSLCNAAWSSCNIWVTRRWDKNKGGTERIHTNTYAWSSNWVPKETPAAILRRIQLALCIFGHVEWPLEVHMGWQFATSLQFFSIHTLSSVQTLLVGWAPDTLYRLRSRRKTGKNFVSF